MQPTSRTNGAEQSTTQHATNILHLTAQKNTPYNRLKPDGN
jgi:hypothetical protein